MFAKDSKSPRDARVWAEQILDEWRVKRARDDLLLIVSELVTNSVQHGVGPIKVALELTPPRIKVSVTDDGQGAVRIIPSGAMAEGGRGIRIVDSLAVEWGVEGIHDRQKTVWAQVSQD